MNPDAIIESVPNFSEGSDTAVLNRLRDAALAAPGVILADIHRDADHNRSVFTLLGKPEPLLTCLLNLVSVAAETIDLNHHHGVHPRIGATDVIPLIPLRDASYDDCIALADHLAALIPQRLPIPTYRYALASRRPDRTTLAQLRKYGYEGLRDRIQTDPYYEPDFGPKRLTSAGATAVGARPILIAYNVNLTSDNLTAAKAIAKQVRASSGGLPAVQALGLMVDGRAQVSTNLLDYRVTPLPTLYRAVESAARELGETVAEAELVGCLPKVALCGDDPETVGLPNLAPERFLETHLARFGSHA